jgi:thioester reductase-like protein
MAADEEAMERANIEGTKHVIEFANSIDVGRFHHTSSIAVAGLYKGVFQEDMFDEGQRLPHAYHRTKYESERLVREGIRASTIVYRPGIVVGHSETGEMDKIDGPYYRWTTSPTCPTPSSPGTRSTSSTQSPCGWATRSTSSPRPRTRRSSRCGSTRT